MSAAAADQHVVVSRDGPVATITLNRPEKLNALTMAMLADLDAALGAIDADNDVRVVIVTGAGEKAFSAGADVVAWSALSPLDMWRTWTRMGADPGRRQYVRGVFVPTRGSCARSRHIS